jgi:hypothetical protein
MMHSSIPVPEDQVGAIITLVGLAHEKRGYADTKWREYSSRLCRIGYYRPHPYESSHADTLSGTVCCRVAAFKQQKTEAFYLTEQDESSVSFDHVSEDRQDSLY